jgi:hypothetical protein
MIYPSLTSLHHPSQNTVGNVHKASGNRQQRSLQESIAELLSLVLGLPSRLSVSPPEEHHERRTVCRRGGNERVTAVLRSIPREAFADSFQKLHERCQQCIVKDSDYFEGQ